MLGVPGVARAAAPPQWVEVRSPHFVVISDANEKTARRTAGQFERMRALFQKVLPSGAADAGIPVTVLALRNRAGFETMTPADRQGKGQMSLAGLFLPTQDRNYVLLRMDVETEHPFSVVYHEYTHFLTRKSEWLPVWLNEGLAEFYENTDIHESDVMLGQPSTNDILFLRENRLIPLATLFAVDHNSPYYHDQDKGSVFYAESWALTHMIISADFANKTRRMGDYAQLLAAHTDPVMAAQKAFGDLGQLQKALDNYVSNGNYKQFAMKTGFTSDDASFAARPLTLTDVNSVRADVLAHVGREREASAMIDDVLRADPTNALAHETKGSLAYREHDTSTAEKEYAEAVRLKSESYLAYFHYATLAMREKEKGQDEAVESALRTCIKLAPEFPQGYDALAQFFAMRNEKLDEAHNLTLKAVQLEPAELSYRVNAASVLVQQKDFDGAIAVLKSAGAVTHGPQEREMLQARLNEVVRYKQQMARYESAREARASGAQDSSAASAGAGGAAVDVTPGGTAEDAKFPLPTAGAPKKSARGVLRNVRCSYPASITMELEQPGKSLTLFAPNMYKLTFSTMGYQDAREMDPCKMLTGMKARVTYAEVSDKTLTGQVDSIELSK